MPETTSDYEKPNILCTFQFHSYYSQLVLRCHALETLLKDIFKDRHEANPEKEYINSSYEISEMESTTLIDSNVIDLLIE